METRAAFRLNYSVTLAATIQVVQRTLVYYILFNSLKMTKAMSEGVAEMLRSAQAFTHVC